MNPFFGGKKPNIMSCNNIITKTKLGLKHGKEKYIYPSSYAYPSKTTESQSCTNCHTPGVHQGVVVIPMMITQPYWRIVSIVASMKYIDGFCIGH